MQYEIDERRRVMARSTGTATYRARTRGTEGQQNLLRFLEVAMQLGLDENDSVEELLDDLFLRALVRSADLGLPKIYLIKTIRRIIYLKFKTHNADAGQTADKR